MRFFEYLKFRYNCWKYNICHIHGDDRMDYNHHTCCRTCYEERQEKYIQACKQRELEIAKLRKIINMRKG